MTQTRKYKGFTPTMGIWMVKNLKNGKVWLGGSEHVQAKLNGFQFQLKMGSCMNRPLQQEYNQDGPEHFVFEVLDELKPDPSKPEGFDYRQDLKDLEDLWLDKLQPYEPNGYHRPKKA